MPEDIIKIGDNEVAREDFFSALGEVSGGKLTQDNFENVLGLDDKYNELQAKYSDLEAKSNVSPFFDEFASTVNEMRKNGKSPSDIALFAKIQDANLEKMSPKEVIRLSKQIDYPGLTNAEINALMDEEYKMLGEEDEGYDPKANMLAQANMKIHAKEALKKLSEMRVDLTKNPIAAQKQQQQEQLAKATEFWGETVGKLKSDPFSFATEVDKGVEYKFDFDFEKHKDPKREDYVFNSVIQSALAKGYPTNEAGLQQIKADLAYARQIAYGDLIRAAMVKDMHASLMEQIVKQESGGHVVTDTPPNTGEKKINRSNGLV